MNVKYLLKCIFASENKSLTRIGSLRKLNPGLLLGMKNVHIFKPCLEYYHWGFLLFEENSAGGRLILLEGNSVESVNSSL